MLNIWSKGPGRLGNRIFNLMLGRHISSRIQNSRVVYEHLPEFGHKTSPRRIDHLRRQMKHNRIAIEGHVVDWSELREFHEKNKSGSILNRGYGMRFEYFEDQRPIWQERVRRRAIDIDPKCRADSETLYVHIRAEDILRKAHADYFPLPIRFYQTLVRKGREAGIRDVQFIGQVEGSHPYLRELRSALKDCVFSEGDALGDFMKLATARYRVISISSFAWLAAWMSPTPSTTIIPVAGLFDPERRPDIDLLSQLDSSFVQCKFENAHWSHRRNLTDYLAELDYTIPQDLFHRFV